VTQPATFEVADG